MKRHRLVWTSEPPAAGKSILQAFAPVDRPVVRGTPTHYCELTPRDEAIFLLRLGADIEHSLMVQYLYAGYSLDPDSAAGEEREKVRLWQQQILEISREEMGHLVTVQNLLRVIGGPLSFARQDAPYQSDFYPFPFQLAPLSKTSLAKFIVAEMPENSTVQKLTRSRSSRWKGMQGRP